MLSPALIPLSRCLSGSVIEKFTENTRFCLICNYLSKIIPALQSRCTRFRFGPLSPDQMIPRLEHVVQQERCVCEGECVNVSSPSTVQTIWGRRDFKVLFVVFFMSLNHSHTYCDMCYSQKTSEAIAKKLAVPVGLYTLFFIMLLVWVSQETCCCFTA